MLKSKRKKKILKLKKDPATGKITGYKERKQAAKEQESCEQLRHWYEEINE